MDSDRKYRQAGYMDSDRDSRSPREAPKPQGPRPSIDVTGPRLPRLVQHVAAARCFNCSNDAGARQRFHGQLPEMQCRNSTAASSAVTSSLPRGSSA